MKKLLLIINPCAGKMNVKSELFGITQSFCEAGWLVTTKITVSRGEATDISREASGNEEYDLIVCCGGDGTLNEVINGLLQSGKSTPVGYIPAGSTNDFASSMKIPTDLVKAAKSIAGAEKSIHLDVGRFNADRVFTYIASFGAFTATSYNVPQNLKNAMGHFAYVLGGIMDLGSIKPYHVELHSDGGDCVGDYVFGAISNSSSVGKIIKLNNEQVSLNDGKFEVLMVKNPTNPALLQKVLWGLLNRNFSDKEVFEFFQASEIKMSLPETVNWTLDGEFEKGSGEVVIENLHSAITLRYTPDKAVPIISEE